MRDEWIAAKPDTVAGRVAKVRALIDTYRSGDGKAEHLESAIELLSQLPENLRDPDVFKLRIYADYYTKDDWWDTFVRATEAYPGYFYTYSIGVHLSIGDDERMAQLVNHARTAGRAMGWGDSLLARVISIAGLYMHPLDWQTDWATVQSAYHDLFKVFPRSYKNMFRFAMMACKVKDRRVARSMEPLIHLMDPPPDIEWGAKGSAQYQRALATWALSQPYSSWIYPPALPKEAISEAKLVPVSMPKDEVFHAAAYTFSGWVRLEAENWPPVTVDPAGGNGAGIEGAETGFFTRSAHGKLYFVTASSTGAAPSVRMKNADGSIAQLSPDRLKAELLDPDIPTQTFRYEVPASPIAELRHGAEIPAPDMSVFVVSPERDAQVVAYGILMDVVQSTAKYGSVRRFRVALPPGSPLPKPGAPVLTDNGQLLGVVFNASVVEGWVVVDCESASLIVRGRAM